MNVRDYFRATVRRQVAFFCRGAGPQLPYFATHLEIELTNACNLRCPFCTSADSKRPRALLSPAILERLLKHLRRRRRFPRLSFAGDGEPLLHPRVVEMVALAKRLGFHVSLITNGTLLTKAAGAGLIAAGLDRIQLSIDALGAAAYGRSRRSRSGTNLYAVTRRNILDFLQVNVAAGEPVHISVMSVQTVANRRQAARFTAYWRSLPVHHIYLSPLYTLGGELKKQYAPAARAEYRGDPRGKPVCSSPFVLLRVNADGRIFACAHDVNGVYPLARLAPRGRMDLERIWNNRRAQALRRALLTGKLEAFTALGHDCRSCNAPLEGNNLAVYGAGMSAAKLRTIAASMGRRPHSTPAQRRQLAQMANRDG